MKGIGEQAALGAALVRAKLLRRYIPLYVQFAVTNRCNLRCLYCNIPNLPGRDLSLEEISRMGDELRRMGTRRIVLLGGEPMVRPDIGEIIRMMKRKGLFVGLVTNGFQAASRIGEIRSLDTIAVSVDGDEDAHDASRGKGSYRQAVEAMEAIANAGMTRFLSMTLVRTNLHALDHVLALADRFSCKALINTAYHTGLVASTAVPYLASDADVRAVFREIIARKKRGAPILLSETTYRYVRDWPDSSVDNISDPRRIPPHAPPCQAGKLFCYIDAGGTVSPCALWVGERASLNVVTDGVRDAWERCRDHGCLACSVPCFVEYNAIFSLHAGTLWNTLKHYKR